MPATRRQLQREEPISEDALRVLRRFRIVFNAVRTHFRDIERKAGIAGAQVWALSIIHAQPGIGVGALARAMDIHQSTASNLLRALQEQGLVAADRRLADKRAVHLQATAEGVKVLRKAPGPLSGVLPRALAQLDHKALGRLDRDLEELVRLLGDDEKGGRIPLGQPER